MSAVIWILFLSGSGLLVVLLGAVVRDHVRRRTERRRFAMYPVRRLGQ